MGSYDPDKGTLKQYIFSQLRYELRSCAAPYRTTSIIGALRGFRGSEITSLDAFVMAEYLAEECMAA